MTDQRVLVGTRKGLFTLRRSSGGWAIDDVSFLGEPVAAGVVDADGTTFAALSTGHYGNHLWRRAAGASEWSEVGAPSFPPRPDDPADVAAMNGLPWKWSVELMWSLETGHAAHPGELWCGTIPGGLFHSPDSGATWELNRPLWDMPDRRQWMGGGYDWPGIHTISIDPRNAASMLVAISCGGAWYTDDGGESWTASTGMRNEYMPPGEEYNAVAQDPHRVARCQAHPDVVWNQHHNGCFRSTDGGRTWTEIIDRPPSVFGFGVAAHPTDPNTAWFAPAVKDEARYPVGGALVVTRTTDGGASFESFGDGLPNEHAYDLVYRHCLEVDASGDRLAMASTTGSLWISESAGESWSLVNGNLPPVYFLRWM